MTSAKQTQVNYSPPASGILIPWHWIGIFFLFLALAVAAYFIWQTIRGSDIERGTRALVEALGRRRLIEPRLTGGFKAAEFSGKIEDRTGIDEDTLKEARILIEDAYLRGDEGAKSAYARLLLAQNSTLSEAQNLLKSLTPQPPSDPGVHNDLGVCLLLRGRIEDALEEFKNALKLEPRMPEALYNRALCFQRLFLRRPAAEGYADFIEVETDAGWLEDARQRHELLSGPITPPANEEQTRIEFYTALKENDLEGIRRIVTRGYEHVTLFAYEEMKAHLEAFISGDLDGAEQHMRNLERIGEHAHAIRSDSTISESGEYLRGMPDEDKAVELELLNKFIEAYRLERRDPAKALELCEPLIGPFEERGNYVFLGRSIFLLGNLYVYSGKLNEAVAKYRRGRDIAIENGWIFDEPRHLLNLGMCYSRLGQDSRAIEIAKQSLVLFKRINENPAKIHQFLGLAYWHLGSLQTALDQFRQSTAALLDNNGRFEDLAYNYLNVADIYRLAERPDLALLNGEQALELSGSFKADGRLAQSLSFVAVERARAGDFQQAEVDIKNSFALLNEMKAARDHTEVLLLTRTGVIANLRGEKNRAIELYTAAGDKAVGQRQINQRINALQMLAETYIDSGQPDKARPILTKAIEDVEHYRGILENPGDRIKFLSARQVLFDKQIEIYAADPSSHIEAFGASDRSRARTLLDRIETIKDDASKLRDETGFKEDKPAAVRLAELQRSIPANTTVLLYSVTGQDTFIFTVTPTTLDVSRSQAGSAKIEQMVSKFVNNIVERAPIQELAETGNQLYGLLIRPVETKISRSVNLCIIPDKALNFLPFAALKDDSNRYLAESHCLTIAPSASLLTYSLGRRANRGADSVESFLSVGNPTLSADMAEEMSELPEAVREAKLSAANYENQEVLIGSGATERSVRDALRRCNVAHLAVHCLVKPESPLLAALILAEGSTEPDDDGALSLDEVYDLKLKETHLVVLSACQSALGQFYRGEGIVSLIHPLLSAGVSTVVASLWPVDSIPTADLMIEFHRVRTQSVRTSGDALREAQIRMIRMGRDHPYYWASFIVVGGNY
jgi:CHAT domain-containing protein/tetratricopeptide (TPR) repeat protein